VQLKGLAVASMSNPVTEMGQMKAVYAIQAASLTVNAATALDYAPRKSIISPVGVYLHSKAAKTIPVNSSIFLDQSTVAALNVNRKILTPASSVEQDPYLKVSAAIKPISPMISSDISVLNVTHAPKVILTATNSISM
jgi:hypothetical protein